MASQRLSSFIGDLETKLELEEQHTNELYDIIDDLREELAESKEIIGELKRNAKSVTINFGCASER